MQKNIIGFNYKFGFLIKLCLILIISSLISVFIFYNFVNYEVGQSYTNTRFVLKSVNDFLFPSLWFSITILTLILSLGTIIVSIFVSHRIAGPIYRLEVSFRDFKAGHFYKITLRTKDQIKGLVRILNEFIEKLIGNISLCKKHSLNIKGLIEEEKKESVKETTNYDNLNKLNEKIKGELKSIKSILANYKTE